MANTLVRTLLGVALGWIIVVPVAAQHAVDHGPAISGKRVITMAAVEPKGGATVDKEAFPTSALPEGGGYMRKEPDSTGRWEVSTYRWMPSQIIVNQGDEVTLEIVGINGDEHPAFIEGYGRRFTVKRGEVTRVTFKAARAGVFRILCDTHHPSMHGELIVLAGGRRH